MACECIICPECNGSGTVWYSFNGDYIGYFHSDDLDSLGSCEQCGGSGVSWMCEECQQAYLDDESSDW